MADKERDAKTNEPTADTTDVDDNTGDGPSSHDTSGEFPADEVNPEGASAREGEGANTGDGPDSTETCGDFPSQEVRQTFPGTGTDPQTAEGRADDDTSPRAEDGT